jgi:DNA-binding NarL/FixJ family response regulator
LRRVRDGTSEDTVKNHMKTILANLEAKDGTHATMIANKRGALEK